MSIGIKTSRSSWSETLIIVVEALAIAMFVRIFFYQPFNIPSGSMKETLLIGDYLFVSKLSYGYSKYLVPVQPEPFLGPHFRRRAEARRCRGVQAARAIIRRTISSA